MDLKEKIEQLEKQLEELKAEANKPVSGGRWKPKNGERYYRISSVGCIDKIKWINSPYDNSSYKIGNCFQTKEAAEFEVERLKVLAEMKEFAEPEDREWNGDNNHFFYYVDVCTNKVKIDYDYYVKGGEVYFESKGKVEECIQTVGEERIKKYYFRVKDGE